MKFREAQLEDIAQIQVVRHLVKENTLSDPALVPDKDVAYYITEKGKGWVCATDGKIVGFSIVDLQEHSIWALFVDPEYDRRGIGKELHRLMMDWYFAQTKEKVCLGTAPKTRAEEFYKRQGWTPVGFYANGEAKFEMNFEDWRK
ncbi:GNAT family N-acetyltransferase [Flavobacterium sp.]|uniref:GNAT family N-acetyltransferase n=1 Tax=Flavobacterium sp. TaxID=239 RepID=UPI0039E3AFC5